MIDRDAIGARRTRRFPIFKVGAFLLGLSVLALLVARIFFVELVIVRGYTMAPAVLEGDVLLVSRGAIPQLGDVVVIEDGERAVLRRVLAQPGAIVGAADGVLMLDGLPVGARVYGTFGYVEDQGKETPRPHRQQLLLEPVGSDRAHPVLGDFIGSARPWFLELPDAEVPLGHLFVFCDNRRVCPIDELSGVVDQARIVGVARQLMWYGEARLEAPQHRPFYGAFEPLRSQLRSPLGGAAGPPLK